MVRTAIVLGSIIITVVWLITWPLLASLVTVAWVIATAGLCAAYLGNTKAWRIADTPKAARQRLARGIAVATMLICCATTAVGWIKVAEALA